MSKSLKALKKGKKEPIVPKSVQQATGTDEKKNPVAKADLVGYIHKVSPSKRSRRNIEYFNFRLQDKTGETPGVCFSPGKRNLFVEREKTKTAVKLARFNMSKDGKTIFINDMTKLTSPNSSEYDFQFQDTTVKGKNNLKTVLESSADMEMVDVVAKVVYKDAQFRQVGSAKLKRSECIIGDESSNVKLVLWEGDIEKVNVGEVYAFGNVRIRDDGMMEGKKLLNTTKDTSIEKQNEHPLKNLATTAEKLTETTTMSFGNETLTVRFIHSVEELTRYKVCCDCKRKIQQDTGRAIVKCDSCGHVMRSISCSSNLLCKFSVKKVLEKNSESAATATDTQPHECENVKFVIFKDMLEALIGKVELLEDEEICEKLLLLENFAITYTGDNIVCDVKVL